MKRIGLIINPIAGMGGRVGLKGTDGVLQEAIALGATPQSPKRATAALQIISGVKDKIELITCSGDMGENEAIQAGIEITGLINIDDMSTTGNDTIEAAIAMVNEYEVELLVFAGGDGTARDIYSAVGDRVIVIGIPAGVKIHSPVYASNPRKAGELAVKYVKEQVKTIREAEVLDIDEESYRAGIVKTSLYGYLKIPNLKEFTQCRKMGTPMSEAATQNLIALDVIDSMRPGIVYIVGPGSTTRPILENLNLKNTLLGFDAILNKRLFDNDLSEADILKIIEKYPCRLILTPTGGQGYILGRGNQQISPRVLEKVGKESITIVATKEKLSNLEGRPLMVDTGDIDTDDSLRGYFKVITGYNEVAMYKLDA